MHTIYKVVKTTKTEGMYSSFVARNEWSITYQLGKTVTSSTPLFVFGSLIAAAKYAGNSNDYAILEGYSTQEPFYPRIEYGFDVYTEPYSPKIAALFWEDFFHLPKKEIYKKYEEKLMGIAADTLFVYNFTPTYVVPTFLPLTPKEK